MGLFFAGVYAMLCEFTLGAFADAGLFSQRFSANAVLAGLADAAFEY
jgi:hypothetical protein